MVVDEMVGCAEPDFAAAWQQGWLGTDPGSPARATRIV